MISAIQHAYYLQARNPSNADTLIALAAEIGLDADPLTGMHTTEPLFELLPGFMVHGDIMAIAVAE